MAIMLRHDLASFAADIPLLGDILMKLSYLLTGALVLFLPATARAQLQPGASNPKVLVGPSTPDAPSTPSGASMRTHVSGLGNDANPCTAVAPCRSLQIAFTLTTAGGEIYVLDSADFGPLTINKAVTITGEGATAGILATSGNAITINAGTNDAINLRGLDVDGGGSGGIGIQFNTGGFLIVQKSVVRGFNSGINFTPNGSSTFFASDVVVSNNQSNGILVAGAGTNTVIGTVHRVTASGNGVGIHASGSAASIAVTDTIASKNNYGVGAAGSSVVVRNTTFIGNAIGISSQDGAIVRVTQSTLTANGTGLHFTNGGQLLSFGDNNVAGNATNGTTTGSISMQ
jgi:Periplasmic copper-binding protein (NosD)